MAAPAAFPASQLGAAPTLIHVTTWGQRGFWQAPDFSVDRAILVGLPVGSLKRWVVCWDWEAKQRPNSSALDDWLGESPFTEDAANDDADDVPDAKVDEGDEAAEADRVEESSPKEESSSGGVHHWPRGLLGAPSVDTSLVGNRLCASTVRWINSV